MSYGFMIDFFLRLVEPLFPYTFDLVLQPLLSTGSPHTGALLTVFAVSVGLSAILMGIRYLLMDLDEYKKVQEKRKELNKQMKEAQKDGEIGDTNKHMQDMFALQKDMFSLQMRPMISSMVIFFILLPWMYVTFIPIVDMTATNGDTYTGELVYNGHTVPIELRTNDEDVVIIDGTEYHTGDSFQLQDLPWKVKTITVDEDTTNVRFAAEIVQLPFSVPGVGDELGWLGTYIILVIPFTMIFGKLLGIQ